MALSTRDAFLQILFSVWRKHNERLSVKRGSFFHDMNLTLSEGLKILYWWSVKSTLLQTHRETRVSKRTVGDYFQFIREICAEVVITNRQPIGGYDEQGHPRICEIDESKFGAMKYHKVGR